MLFSTLFASGAPCVTSLESLDWLACTGFSPPALRRARLGAKACVKGQGQRGQQGFLSQTANRESAQNGDIETESPKKDSAK